MPRRPTRHRRLLKPMPLTFSSFGRSVAQVASSYMAKRQKQDLKLRKESPLNSAGICNCMLSKLFIFIFYLHEVSFLSWDQETHLGSVPLLALPCLF